MLDEILGRHEGKTLEFKRDASSSPPISRTLCSFSNTAGGTIVIGVEDGTRNVVGLPDPLSTQDRIASIATDTIHPQITPEIEVASWRGKSVVVVTVFPGPARPYHVRKLGPQAGTYVRVGSANRHASPEIVAELARTTRNVTFDEEPLQRLTRDAIDLKLAKERFEGVRDLRERDLVTMRVMVSSSGRVVPTTGGVLLFGRKRLEEFPDARIRAARFAGSDRSRIIDRADLDADPVAAIEDAMAFVTRHTARGMEIRGARRCDMPQYPPVAVREAIVNAVAHADYSQAGSPIRIAVFDDRIEIENPGLLPFGLTVEEILGGISKLRNRVIGRVFHELGLIEQWGSGIQRILASCRDAGLDIPRFEEVGTHFRVTLFAKKNPATPGITGTPARILTTLRDAGPLSTSEIAGRLGLTTRTVRTHLGQLAGRGLILEIGQGPHDPKKTWSVPSSPA